MQNKYSRFIELLEQMREIHNIKQHDYSGDEPYSNFMLAKKMGIEGWRGCLIRMTDKISRLWQKAKDNDYMVKDEKFIDTAIDLAVYSIILIILYEQEVVEGA